MANTDKWKHSTYRVQDLAEYHSQVASPVQVDPCELFCLPCLYVRGDNSTVISDMSVVEYQTAQNQKVLYCAEVIKPLDYTANIAVYTIDCTYRVSKTTTYTSPGSLIDGGCNGGIAGSDVLILRKYPRTINVTGIDNHQMSGLPIVDAVAKVMSHRGPVIAEFRQYAYYGRMRTIHSVCQISYGGHQVNDQSLKIGGKQRILTDCGLMMPLDIVNGMAYLKMTPPSKQELEDLPRVVMTNSNTWDPKVVDSIISDREDWYSIVKDDGEEELVPDSIFDDNGYMLKKGTEQEERYLSMRSRWTEPEE